MEMHKAEAKKVEYWIIFPNLCLVSIEFVHKACAGSTWLPGKILIKYFLVDDPR